MIKFIAAIDDRQGLADDNGIPWHIPTDLQYFRDHTVHNVIMMGYNTYLEFTKPLSSRRNLVATTKDEVLKPGFERVAEAHDFLSHYRGDIWVIGGAGLFAATLDLADELYLTELEGDFNCTKFFPAYDADFVLTKKGVPIHENGVTFRFNVYSRKT